MATTDCAHSVIRRGYLVDKKGSILERKRWFVLRQDFGQGYCILENYKDEKSALRGESPKGFINVYQVVDVRRSMDKKQCFELLCPGIAHRLMANSEADADEWVDSLRKLNLFRKEDIRSLSLQRIMTQPMVSGSPISSSPPKLPFNSMAVSHSLTIPQSIHSPSPTANPVSMFNGDIPVLLGQSPQTQSMQQLQQTYPTPPESIVMAAPPVQKQNSIEATHPYPSPPSSDSSSMYSGSNTSFDNASVADGDAEMNTRSKFRVHVKENERLAVSGPCDVIISEDSITLHSVQTGYPLGFWPVSSIRRYGVNNVCFTFETGKNCFTGEGKFFLYCPQSRLMHSRVHHVAQRKDHRRASAPDTLMSRAHTHTISQPLPTHLMHQRSSPAATSFSTSPPHYSHIEHTLRPNLSLEPYGKINTRSSPAAASVFTQPLNEYEKLNHTLPASTHSLTQHTVPPRCNYSTIKHNIDEEEEEEEEISPIYSNIQLAREKDEDNPPPLPPRLTKMNST